MDAAPKWISLRAYARHRGVALAAVQKAIESGRVTAVRRNAAGRLKGVDQVAADEQWLANTDPVESAKTTDSLRAASLAAAAGVLPFGALAAPRAEALAPPAAEAGVSSAGGAAAPQAAAADPEAVGKDFGYFEARAKREQFQAKQAELQYLEAIGQLVPKAELQQAAFRRYRAIRDKLLNIPDRLGAILAAETDPHRVHSLLGKEIQQVLHELSDDARAEAARGAAERVAA